MQSALGFHGDRSLLSSLVGWIAGNATPSFIEGQSLSAEVRVIKATAGHAVVFIKLFALTSCFLFL